MKSHRTAIRKIVVGLVATVFTCTAWAQELSINVYSARHYPSDALLYGEFTKRTGIKINRVDADDAGILARLKAEGSASPADVILLVDAARLWKGEQDGLFLPVKSTKLTAAIPSKFKSSILPDGTTAWFGLSTRARVIVYDKSKVNRVDVATYQDLGDPKNRGKLCTRSGSHPYNLSLFGAMLVHQGQSATQTWLKGMVDNMARPPTGGDTDQIKAVASGECAIAITNTYYLARLMRSDHMSERAVAEKVGVVFPNQASWGTHLNIAGGAVAKHSKNVAGAVAFLEYLATPEAQEHFANGNNEWPVAMGVKSVNSALTEMSGGAFKSETIPVQEVGKNQLVVQQMLDRVGYR